MDVDVDANLHNQSFILIVVSAVEEEAVAAVVVVASKVSEKWSVRTSRIDFQINLEYKKGEKWSIL